MTETEDKNTTTEGKMTKTEIVTTIVLVAYLISLFIVMLKELGIIWAK
jgi:hypothetical protein